MKAIAVVLCSLAMVTTGCSSASQEASDPSMGASAAPSSAQAAPSATADAEAVDTVAVDTAAVDAVLDQFASGSQILNTLGSTDDTFAEFERAQSEWAGAAAALRSGIRGVPAEAIDPALQALDAVDSSMTAVLECVQEQASGCDAEFGALDEDATAVGTAVAALVPYGSRTEEEFLASLGGPDTGGTDADAGAEAAPAESVAQSNAREKAQEYLDYSAFSRQGLIDQLEYEGFSTADATYGADAVGADWNEQAALKAQEYLDYSAFSRSGLIDQLEYEGFTRAQATYGADSVGL